ncbi:hypothetical protein GCM10023314_01650 [Algibacter agarivorans]|uniref:HTH cro/C1-type domain-containing protein n=2 Tax=Algibacter agarivorans TaxID=1109741 RepID=A0ABP9G8J1_9FLAO
MQLSLKEIDENTRELRLERQFQLYFDADVAKNQIGRIERGEHVPNIISLIKIANALDVGISEIVDLKKN